MSIDYPRVDPAGTPKWCKFAVFATLAARFPEGTSMKLIMRSILPLQATLLLAACGPRKLKKQS